jgi:hypothetical protein
MGMNGKITFLDDRKNYFAFDEPVSSGADFAFNSKSFVFDLIHPISNHLFFKVVIN